MKVLCERPQLGGSGQLTEARKRTGLIPEAYKSPVLLVPAVIRPSSLVHVSWKIRDRYFTKGATISRPKRIEEITISDLSEHRWCYFHDDEYGFDPFEWVIPDTHPKFDTRVIELELATFQFHGGQEFLGMLACTQFSVCLAGEWHSFSTGIVKPTEYVKSLKGALWRLGLALPVVAKAKWSGTSELYNGIRYFEHGNEVEVWDT